MKTHLFALFTDEQFHASPAFLFRSRRDAEHAIHACHLKDADIVSFTCQELLHGMMQGIVYLALRCEDAGIRVMEAFRSPFTLQTFLMDHVGEGNCRAGMAWLEPRIRDDRLIYGVDRKASIPLRMPAFGINGLVENPPFLHFEEPHLREALSE